ncbi:hypothetical protein M0811_10889 [Anaeramoeba ignava]|uniref:DNA/RNA-binding protein Alba-like domain-containing protein n=1 Tax=Anaeramoeba ignava TaxID=1746090 RepID=A0A9Q0LCM2_ANAIG|nr:hypothetical protein M0811_10889 [Anaeramoeba ignava]
MDSNSIIKICTKGKISNYVKYGNQLIENGNKKITIVGVGNVMNKVVSVAEILKRKNPKFHQINSIQFVEIETPSKTTKKIPSISIFLSLEKPENTALGYQAPLEEEKNEEIRRLGPFIDMKKEQKNFNQISKKKSQDFQ